MDYFACMCICVIHASSAPEAGRGCQILWYWSYRRLWDSVGAGDQTGSYARATNARNHWPSTPNSLQNKNITFSVLFAFCCCWEGAGFLYVPLVVLELSIWDQAGLKTPRKLPASASQGLGLKAWATMPGFQTSYFSKRNIYKIINTK